MQRPQEKEKKQEDRAELLEMGVHVPTHSSLSLPAFLRELSLRLSTLPLFDPHVHKFTRNHTHIKTHMRLQMHKKKRHQMDSLSPTHITES